MRILTLIGSLCLSITCLAAQPSQPTQANATHTAIVELSKDEGDALVAQQNAFFNAPELSKRLTRLLELEQQALQLAVDEPLKLGSIGTAILDIYPGSQTGHYVLGRFYEHVESTEAQAEHDLQLAKLQALMRASGEGLRRNPYHIITIYDAHTFALTLDTSPVGSIYRTDALDHFGYVLVARPSDRPLRQWHFDLSHLLTTFEDETHESHQPSQQSSASNAQAKPWLLMQRLAGEMDSAAQTAIGRYLASIEKWDDALSWLKVAARSGNVLANTLMARIYLNKAETAESDENRESMTELALENHLHAIALGSTDSMYALANLYLNDFYGEDNRAAGIGLLTKSANLEHAESLLYLGHLYSIGREVSQDNKTAAEYFARAAALKKPQAILSYGRFLTSLPSQELELSSSHEQLLNSLQSLAKEHAEAAVVLANLYARGIGSKASNRLAYKWYKKAVKQAPLDADIVNEVAWTLTVSDIAGLARAKYAKKVMDHLMQNVPQARQRPEYLDTWAATHAARGEFDEAIKLQQEAIGLATTQQREDVLDILQEHLQLFETGAAITEKAP